MTSDRHSLRLERLFDVPPDEVFRAWTEKDELKQWFHFADDWIIEQVDVDLRVGGQYRIGWKAPDGNMWYEFGEYREITPPKRIVQTCGFDFPGMPPEMTMLTIDFHARGNQTLVVLLQEGYQSAAMRDNHQQGWPSFLDNLAKLLAAAKRN